MKLYIDTKVLFKHRMSLTEFLDRLKGYFYNAYEASTAPYRITLGNVRTLSVESKNKVAEILIESDPKLEQYPKGWFEETAEKIQEIYPSGLKQGTKVNWRSNIEDIAFNLKLLVTKYDFNFTQIEAIQATKEYIEDFKSDLTYMKLLKNFIIEFKDYEMTSDFMTIIENNRENEK